MGPYRTTTPPRESPDAEPPPQLDHLPARVPRRATTPLRDHPPARFFGLLRVDMGLQWAYWSNRKISMQTKRVLDMNDDAGVRINKTFRSFVSAAGGYDNLNFVERDVRNYVAQSRRALGKEGEFCADIVLLSLPKKKSQKSPQNVIHQLMPQVIQQGSCVGGVPSVLTNATEGNINSLNGMTHASGGVSTTGSAGYLSLLNSMDSTLPISQQSSASHVFRL
ncbi:hypothetical protein VNO80_11530 [Phaseolus coccineus]|uniref:Uncharacterized protein n=1 Tax=Phaseolus coccineus TaxID=3886 RepID=A0AAN9NBW3_PHACN